MGLSKDNKKEVTAMNDKLIGILGGMGPEATAHFYFKLIKATPSKTDQDHFRVIMDSNSKIPDRTSAIFGNGENPVPALIETAKTLECAKVDVACIPCITAHYFIDEIQESVNFPILNALRELDIYIKANYPDIKNIGILATSGTLKTGLFNKYLSDYNLIYPDYDIQTNKVMQAIYSPQYGIKSGVIEGKPIDMLVETGEILIKNGAQILIAGCTEIGLVLNSSHFDIPLIDPMDVVIEAIVKNKR